MIELQRCTDKEQWDEYVLDNGGHPLQLWSWGQVKAGHGWKAERMLGIVDGDVVAAAQVLVRRLPSPFRSFAYVPRGPMFHVKQSETVSEEFLEELAKFTKREYHSVALSIEPDSFDFSIPQGWTRATNKILSHETILLDLKKTEADLLSSMAKKTRQYIRKSATGIQIKKVSSQEDIAKCLAIYQDTAKRAGFNLHNNQYYYDVSLQMKDYSPIFAAYVNGEPVSFLWLAMSGETAYELYGGMSQQGQDLRANYALKWYAIRKAKEWGLAKYDFGGLVAGGVSNFKQGWSAEVTTFAGTFDKPLSPLYVLWSKALPFAKRTVQKLRTKRSKA